MNVVYVINTGHYRLYLFLFTANVNMSITLCFQARLSWRSTESQARFRTACCILRATTAAARRSDCRPCTSRSLWTLPIRTPSSLILMSTAASPALTAVTSRGHRLHRPHPPALQPDSHAEETNTAKTRPTAPRAQTAGGPTYRRTTSGQLFPRSV